MIPLPTTDRLSIYLNDHLAGATAGVELAWRAARQNEGNEYGAVLGELASEIAADRAALVDIMERLSIGQDRLKVVLAWGAEKAGRLKLNGSLTSYSPLSRLVELEALTVGVEGKLAGWIALRETHGDDARLRDVDLGKLIDRARAQRRRLERLRRRAAADALASG